MRRRLLTLASILSLPLCVVTVVIWVRSYSISDAWYWGSPREQYGLSSGRGTLVLAHGGNMNFPDWGQWLHIPGQLNPRPWLPNVRSFRIGPHWENDLLIPCWLVTLMTILLPTTSWLILYRAARDQKQWRIAGRCPKCGYDLRASPERCPECGRPVAEGIAK